LRPQDGKSEEQHEVEDFRITKRKMKMSKLVQTPLNPVDYRTCVNSNGAGKNDR
jgi:hypothetical protein